VGAGTSAPDLAFGVARRLGLAGGFSTAHTATVSVWLSVVVLGGLALVAACSEVRIRRYMPGHLVAHFTVAGRGLYFSRTPDGVWCRWRLLSPRCRTTLPCDWGDPPGSAGVREPRHPLGPGPAAGAVELDPPTG